ncbi:ATP-dependent Clp protease ATP-binding subunit, partial [Mycobacterium kansasii]
VLGRDKETAQVIEILNRRTKNNPVLIGEAGVGKTAVVEGLAERIVEGNVPEKLTNKQIIRLDVVSLVQGTGIRGQFEQRM